mgnify:CR=1 FL=1
MDMTLELEALQEFGYITLDELIAIQDSESENA